MFEAGLVNLLKTTAGVTAIVGDRIFPVQGPPANPTYPYITYVDVTGSSDYATDAELRTVRIQFDLWDEVYSGGKAMALALRNALSGLANETLNDETRILFAGRLNYLDNFDINGRTYRSVSEYEFLIAEA